MGGEQDHGRKKKSQLLRTPHHRDPDHWLVMKEVSCVTHIHILMIQRKVARVAADEELLIKGGGRDHRNRTRVRVES